MNVLSICPKHKEGGYYKRLYSLYRALAEENHTLYYISREKLPVDHKNVVPIIMPGPFRRRENALFWLYFMLSSTILAYKAAKKFRIEAVVTFAPFYTALCFSSVLFARTRAVTFVRADNLKHSRQRLRNLFFYVADWIGVKLSTKIVVVSSVLEEVYRKRYHLPEQKVKVEPNNIERSYHVDATAKKEIRRRFLSDVDQFLISTGGGFSEDKNFSLLVRALHLLPDLRIRLLIVGDEIVPTGERARLAAMVKELSLSEKVTFCGWQRDPFLYVASTDLFVCPSRHEGSPNMLLEALGCGVPCLGSSIAEIREVLQIDDLLFSLESPDELALKLRRAATEAGYLAHLAEACRERAKQFSFDWPKRVVAHVVAAD